MRITNHPSNRRLWSLLTGICSNSAQVPRPYGQAGTCPPVSGVFCPVTPPKCALESGQKGGAKKEQQHPSALDLLSIRHPSSPIDTLIPPKRSYRRSNTTRHQNGIGKEAVSRLRHGHWRLRIPWPPRCPRPAARLQLLRVRYRSALHPQPEARIRRCLIPRSRHHRCCQAREHFYANQARCCDPHRVAPCAIQR